MLDKDSNLVLIKGRLRIFDKDKSGSVIQLFLETDDFRKYIIDNSPAEEGLFLLINEEIIVNCKKSTDFVDALPHITIKSFLTTN